MTNDGQRDKLDQATRLIREVYDSIPPDPPAVNIIKTEQEFDAGMTDSSKDYLVLARDFVYTKPLIVKRKVGIIGQDVMIPGRVNLTDPLPSFKQGITMKGVSDVYLQCLDIRDDNLGDIVIIDGTIRPHINRCRILGDPVKGNKRGIAANGGNMLFEKCLIDDIGRVGQDTQAICTWNMVSPGLVVDDCYLSAAGETFLTGGADSATEETMPSGIWIKDSTLTKKPEWYGMKWQIKNCLELKASTDVHVSNSVLEYAGTAQGQSAFLIVLTPRNQGGKAPWSRVENVLIENCIGGFGGGIVTTLGDDNVMPSGRLAHVKINNCIFHDIDPKGITGGRGWCFFFDRGPDDIAITDITVDGHNLKSICSFDGAIPNNLLVRNIKFVNGMPAPYTWHNPLGDTIEKARLWSPTSTFDVKPTDTGANVV